MSTGLCVRIITRVSLIHFKPTFNTLKTRHDEPPAYDQVIGLPPSYDSVIILNGVSQSRGASVVGSVRNSVLGTVRSLRRSSRVAMQGCRDDGSRNVLPQSV